jgi:hypothetical protein
MMGGRLCDAPLWFRDGAICGNPACSLRWAPSTAPPGTWLTFKVVLEPKQR